MKKLRINAKKLRPLEPSKDYFLSLASSIVSQQISTKAAESIYARFLALFDSPKGRVNKRTITPKKLLSLSEQELRNAGLSNQKVIYMQDLAKKFIDGTIDPKQFPKMSDDEIIEHLTRVKGIGVWTAHMFLIFALNRQDILPIGDLAIKKGFQKAYGLRKLPTDKKMFALAEAHKGKWTELSLHLWSIVDPKSE
ncbi:MAG: DNA-3-methyladenine glycosylase 1-like [Parcubacteria group bacterium]|nr:DNA-3-methyladenine glycosylase 1-like [Parcubacteria group bacterium]